MKKRMLHIRKLKGRNRKGYGLPSMIIVLFFVSVVVTTIVNAMQRDYIEAKAEAAFNVSKDSFETFRVTGQSSREFLPHTFFPIGLSVEQGGSAMVATLDSGQPRVDRLYEAKIRSFLQVPAASALGPVNRDDITRMYPERVMRSGDRMAVDLTSENIVQVGTLEAGTVDSTDATAGRFVGLESTIIEAPRGQFNRLTTNSIDVVNDVTNTGDATATISMTSPTLNANLTEVTTYMSAASAVAQNVSIAGTLITDDLDDIADLNFEVLNVDPGGVRSTDVSSGSLQAGSIIGGQPQGGNGSGGGLQNGSGGGQQGGTPGTAGPSAPPTDRADF